MLDKIVVVGYNDKVNDAGETEYDAVCMGQVVGINVSADSRGFEYRVTATSGKGANNELYKIYRSKRPYNRPV